ncbi:MAG: GIY-YIG nuclease family protein [Bacteroidales bacterium]|nr:GIY-YIG nuclease family protein [Bacteroidales bacterium]
MYTLIVSLTVFSVYILYSESSDRYYVGYTNDLERRISEHNRKKGKFTDAGIPWHLVFSESFNTKREAMKREKYIKSRKSKDFIKELISIW